MKLLPIQIYGDNFDFVYLKPKAAAWRNVKQGCSSETTLPIRLSQLVHFCRMVNYPQGFMHTGGVES